MKIPSAALILIADSEKALFLRNEGDAIYPNLRVERKKTQENPPNREQAANRRGRMSDVNEHKSAMDDTDWHGLTKDRFAGELADILYKRAHRGDYDKLILVATPNSLGEIRSHLHVEVTDKIIGEVNKDLTNHPLDRIVSLLAEA